MPVQANTPPGFLADHVDEVLSANETARARWVEIASLAGDDPSEPLQLPERVAFYVGFRFGVVLDRPGVGRLADAAARARPEVASHWAMLCERAGIDANDPQFASERAAFVHGWAHAMSTIRSGLGVLDERLPRRVP